MFYYVAEGNTFYLTRNSCHKKTNRLLESTFSSLLHNYQFTFSIESFKILYAKDISLDKFDLWGFHLASKLWILKKINKSVYHNFSTAHTIQNHVRQTPN